MKWHIDTSKLFLHNKLVRKKTKEIEVYYINNKLHNPNGSALQIWAPNGFKWYEMYSVYGKKHRTDGPAVISYGLDYKCSYYYLNGHRYLQEEFNHIINTQSVPT